MENSVIHVNDSRGTSRFSDYLFWDVDKAKIDLMAHRTFVIGRVFELGTLEDLIESLSFYGVDVVKETLTKADTLAENAVDLATVLFKLNPSEFRCFTSKPSPTNSGR